MPVKKGAPQVWPKHAGNVLFDVPIGDKKATEAAFAKAHAVAEVSIVNPRIVTNFMLLNACGGLPGKYDYFQARSSDAGSDQWQPGQPSPAPKSSAGWC